MLGGGEVQVRVQQAPVRVHHPQVPVGASGGGARPDPGGEEGPLRGGGGSAGSGALAAERGELLFEDVTFCRQVARLEVEREELLARCRGPDPRLDGKRVEALLREKAQLHMRLKGLEAEVAELRAQKENSGQQAENVQRIQIRQMSEFQSTVKSLEVKHYTLYLFSSLFIYCSQPANKQTQHIISCFLTNCCRNHRKVQAFLSGPRCGFSSGSCRWNIPVLHRIDVCFFCMDGSDWSPLSQAERQSLRQQLERLEGELRLSHEQEAHLTGRLHKAERAASTLTAEVYPRPPAGSKLRPKQKLWQLTGTETSV